MLIITGNLFGTQLLTINQFQVEQLSLTGTACVFFFIEKCCSDRLKWRKKSKSRDSKSDSNSVDTQFTSVYWETILFCSELSVKSNDRDLNSLDFVFFFLKKSWICEQLFLPSNLHIWTKIKKNRPNSSQIAFVASIEKKCGKNWVEKKKIKMP